MAKIDGLYFNGKTKEIEKYFRLIEDIKIGNKKFIACDIDNTICNTNKILEDKGYSITKYPNPILSKEFWLSREGVEILFNAEPIKPVLKFTKTLALAGGYIFLCTSRHEELENVTQSWLRRNRIYTTEKIYFMNNKVSAEADIYIEDNPNEIKKLLRLNKTVIIPTWEYNKDIEGENAIHIYFDNQLKQQHKQLGEKGVFLNV